MTEDARRLAFETLVLRAFWLLLVRAFGVSKNSEAQYWRIDALKYLDRYGEPGVAALHHRRSSDFPSL